ncbi:caspase family protein [uncultured Pseudodesulfovibrio sp.]|uniref:caspase family protein n=1 Tax=uncultured Pseudodesulfovibrio sp. TaxID=2035858 RepID=UPI0029C943C1|nr:caspase family protein [uncultured Pseudodesulfovibrio sp.]
MRTSKFLALIVALLAINLFLPSPARAATSPKTALVIGNSDYPGMPLANPVHDATDISNELKELGFQVTLLTNGTRRQMENAVRGLSKRLADGGVGLFYFAGHGIQVGGENFLIPVDANIESEADVPYEAVSAGRILDHLKLAGNQMNIIILDACRNNPFARSMRSETTGLARMDAPTGSIMAYATAPGSVAADGEGRNGVYTENLLKAMREPGLDIYDTFMQVRRGVIKDTQGKQTPWESSSLIGKFYFREKQPEPVAAPTPPPAPVPDPQTEALKAQLLAMQQQMTALQEQARKNAELAQKREPDESNEELRAQLAAMQQQVADLRQEAHKPQQPAPAPSSGQTEEELKAQLAAVRQEVASLQMSSPTDRRILLTDVDSLTVQKKAKSQAKGRLVLSVVPMAFGWQGNHPKTEWYPKTEQRVLESLAERDDLLPVFSAAGELKKVHPYTLRQDRETALWPEGAAGPPDTLTLKLIAKELHADTLVAVAMDQRANRIRGRIVVLCYLYDARKGELKTYTNFMAQPDAFFPLNDYLAFVQKTVDDGLDQFIGKEKRGWW